MILQSQVRLWYLIPFHRAFSHYNDTSRFIHVLHCVSSYLVCDQCHFEQGLALASASPCRPGRSEQLCLALFTDSTRNHQYVYIDLLAKTSLLISKMMMYHQPECHLVSAPGARRRSLILRPCLTPFRSIYLQLNTPITPYPSYHPSGHICTINGSPTREGQHPTPDSQPRIGQVQMPFRLLRLLSSLVSTSQAHVRPGWVRRADGESGPLQSKGVLSQPNP